MKKIVIAAALGRALSGLALAQTEDELFGNPKVEEKKPGQVAPEPVKKSESLPDELIDKLAIGGRLELRTEASKTDNQRFQESPYGQNKTADIYFDTRPNRDVRAFFRMRFYEQNTTTAQQVTNNTGTETTNNTKQPTVEQQGVANIEESIDELWLKWDIEDTVFVTAGKQHLKWGRGRFWNPTDFTALVPKDPFAIFDRRLGQELIKVHIPFEKQGHNLYGILQFDDAQRNDDVGIALRGEFSFGSNGETAISFQSKRGRPIKAGIDLGMGLGNFDINLESAWSTRDTSPRYKGDLDLTTLQFPSETYDNKKVYNQSVANLEYVQKFNDNDAAVFGVEGFWNQLGYDKRTLEFYSLVTNQNQVLYSGREYVAAYARLDGPGNWNDSTFLLNGVQNLSDKTALVRLTGTYLFYKQITLEAYVSRCFGDYGELCFRVPDSIIDAAKLLPADQQGLINALPRNVTRTVFGGSLSMNF